MERLTHRTPAGVANLDYPQSCFCPDGTKDQVAVSAYRQKAIDRLAAYEDTGLPPEEILMAKEQAEVACALNLLKEYQSIGSVDSFREFAQAEKDGRLVVKPSTPAFLTREEVKAALAKANPTWCDHIKRRFEKVD